MKSCISLLLIFVTFSSGLAQQSNFSKQDTLRGSITPERIWWDLLHYNLDFKVSPSSKSIEGSNLIRYKVLNQNQLMQIDLQPPMEITAVIENNKELNYKREGNVYYIQLKKNQQIGTINEITIHFKGAPKISNNPPWDDGFTWEKDNNGTDFIATSCQGGGSSIWWPSKDHMYDEPDQGIELSITAPKHLISVANGRLIQTKESSNKTNHIYLESSSSN